MIDLPPWMASFAIMLAWHACADFFQGGLSRAKRRLGSDGIVKAPMEWIPALVLHGALHGIGPGIVLGSLAAGVVECSAHVLVDFLKCEKFYGKWVDQGLHLACKGLWLALFYF